jgi:hypothetical protein
VSERGAPSPAARRPRPIFVIGFQRSGTTLLQALLGAHPRIAAPPETYFLLRIANLADHYGDLADDRNLRRALHDTIASPLLADCGFDEERLFAAARAGERTYAGLFEVVMRDFTARHGKARWCDKTPGQRARQVLRLFPDAQLVHIVRDPRDVVASSLETPWTRGSAWTLARAWRAFTRDALAAAERAGAGRYLRVRYEDLTRDPEDELRRICRFLGEAFDPAMLRDPARRRPTIAAAAEPWQRRALEEIRPSPSGSWRERLPWRQAAEVAAVTWREIALFGYDPPGRLALAVGRALAVAHAGEVLAGLRARRRLRRLARDPAARYREVQRHLAEQRRLVEEARERA